MERKPKGRAIFWDEATPLPSKKRRGALKRKTKVRDLPKATSPPSKKWQGALKRKAKFPLQRSHPPSSQKKRGALKTKAPGNPDIRITKRVRVAKEADVNKDAEPSQGHL
ncbi:hypothetical protein M422DRAFT_253494 [Sphaerobolus stellatus SS14]|uniref:Uncharacterized protein n=1 Tax=Sphaerobolus stellatus (strain SS14) TaxID=990650 RepID=A0A0C9V8H8_SPHS4|nr:hypothetical protein M422DRAFT_253494 [Sphaerobolus stellatus SS14]